MKQIYIIILCIFFCVSIVIGCTKNKNTEDTEGKITVTAAIFPPYDFVREIAGDKVHLSMLLPPGAESHSFEPTPKDILTIQKSDIFVYIGGESDEWFRKILGSIDTRAITILPLIDAVEAVEEEIIEGMEAEEEKDSGLVLDGEDEPEYDEHIWTSPKNAKIIVRTITDALCERDAANAGFYRKNADSYTAKLDELDGAFRDMADNAKRKTMVFGDRFPFRYFADAYDLDYFAAFPGCSTETEPSAATVAFLIDKVKAENIPVVFYIEFSNEKMADTICEASGAKKLLLHSAHNVSKKDFDNGLSYIEIMYSNLKHLQEALY